MPGQTGSETRIKKICLPTRWSPQEFLRLEDIARYSGCTKAEVLRRLVGNPDARIFASREFVSEIRRLANNINQIARQLNAGSAVPDITLRQAYADLLKAAAALS